MKTDTRSFYEMAVAAAVDHVANGLDEALDLTALARLAALSPFHFHRVFRGMFGETPLELHRRLRLERAASQLLHGEAPITTIAFDAGYETHEAFTRAFRLAYASSPTELRQGADWGSNRPGERPIELAARSGVHFGDHADGRRRLSFLKGENVMNVDIKDLPDQRVAAVSHVGPYNTISEACERLGHLAGPAGLLEHPGAVLVCIFHDDPDMTSQAELKSDAGIVVPRDATIPETLKELTLPAGRYACTTHQGSYARLGDTWDRLMGEWLPGSGHRVGIGTSFEVYRNTPGTASTEELRTDLYLPIAS